MKSEENIKESSNVSVGKHKVPNYNVYNVNICNQIYIIMH